jgi:two-component system copper resistance phosphate regulon response regulator CusR
MPGINWAFGFSTRKHERLKVLVIEDDERTRAYLARGLSEQGYAVETAGNGLDGLDLATHAAFDVIVLDGMLPGLDGFELLRRLRSTHRTPVIMLTARDAVEDRVRGLQTGADDYLVKPFSFVELVARLEAVLRRGAVADPAPLALADLRLDPLSRRAARAGKPLHLTPKEFLLLQTLLRHQGRVLSKTMLAERVWDVHFDSDLNVIEAAVKRLRSKVDEGHAVRLIHTVRGMGYVLEQREGPADAPR